MKIDRVFDVEAVHGVAAGPVPIALLRIADERIVEFFLEHPRVVEIVFHAGSIDGGTSGVAINEKHVVAFTPPSGRESEDVQDCSYILTLALRFHENVVILAINVLAAGF